MFGQVAYEGDRPIGFVAVTDDANGFLGAALRKRWRTLAAVTLRHPPSPRKAWNVLQLFRERENASGDAAEAVLTQLLDREEHIAEAARRALAEARLMSLEPNDEEQA